jgi:hypothetical protein
MQTVLLIFIAIFSLAIGFFLGMFLLSMDTPLSKRFTGKEESSAEKGLLSGADPVVDKKTPVEGGKKPSPDSRLILQVWKEEGKPPIYDMNGTYLEKEALPKEILNIITVHQEGEPQTPEPTPLPPPPPVREGIQDLPIQEDEGEQEVKMLSVIDEVNDILQKKLAGSPLAGKGIHLMENHNREIRFWVGLNSYNDVDEIPDPEVRKLIDAAVKEWEQNRQ